MNNPNAKNTDPVTAKEAAEAIIRNSQAKTMIKRVVLIVGAYPGSNVSDITNHYNEAFFTDFSREQIAKRVTDARRDELIQVSTDITKKCEKSGKPCYTCWPKHYPLAELEAKQSKVAA
jgi:hypothetical protein